MPGGDHRVLGLPGLPPPPVAAARLGRANLLELVGRTSEAAAELDLLVPFVEQSGSPLYRVHLGWARASLLLLAGAGPRPTRSAAPPTTCIRG